MGICTDLYPFTVKTRGNDKGLSEEVIFEDNRNFVYTLK